MDDKHFVICISNEGFEVSLEPRKIYEVVPDDTAEPLGMIRIIDESHEDYLYSKEMFVEIQLPEPVKKSLLIA